MINTSNLSGTSEAAVLVRSFRSALRLCALLPALTLLAVPALADVYKWTNAKGGTVISDTLPQPGETVKNFQVVEKSPKPDARASVATAPVAPPQAATASEQALRSRVEMLERQLQAQQYAPPPAVAPAPAYYPPQPLPPPPTYYNNGYYPSYAPAYYAPPYYPTYSYPIVSSYAVYPARTYVSHPAFAAPRFGGGGGGMRGGGGRGGRR